MSQSLVRPARAAVLSAGAQTNPLRWLWAGALLAGMAATLTAGIARGDSHEEITVSHGISTFGDLKYSADFKHFDYVNPDAPKGGTMSFVGTGASSTFDSLNPFILKGEPAQGLGALHDSLLTGSADEADSAYGYIAETIEYPESRQWVIFNMRPEATFSDGHPIEASDVVFSLNILLDKGHPAYKISYKDVETVEALDANRVKFTFREGAQTRELIQQVGGMSILPEHYYQDVDFAESTLTPPVSSGGYLVSEAKPGRSIKYCKNPDYWAWDHPTNVGANNFECILFEYFADRTAAFEAFKAGEYLFHEEFFSKIWGTAYNFPAVAEKGWVIKESIPDNRPSGTQGFWFNMRRPQFQDPRVREAIGLMFNFEWSNKTLFYGLYERTDSFWENSPMQAEGLPEGPELALLDEYRDQLPETIFTEPAFSPAVMSERQTDRKAIRAASRLLDDAGWDIVNGVRMKDGKALTLVVLDDSPAFERIINPFVENLKRIGVQARAEFVDAAQNQQRVKDRDYDMIPARLVMSLTPGLELRQIFSSESAAAQDTANYSGVADPVIDKLIETAIGARDREELTVAIKALDRVLRSKHIWVPNWYKASHNIAYWDVFGRPDTKPPYSRGDAYWWWDEEKFQSLKAQGAL